MPTENCAGNNRKFPLSQTSATYTLVCVHACVCVCVCVCSRARTRAHGSVNIMYVQVSAKARSKRQESKRPYTAYIILGMKLLLDFPDHTLQATRSSLASTYSRDADRLSILPFPVQPFRPPTFYHSFPGIFTILGTSLSLWNLSNSSL